MAVKSFLTDIANTIREVKGTSDLINARNFKKEIREVASGIQPSGTLPITDNGIYVVTDYHKVDVNVPTGTPIEVTTGEEMEALLVEENIGKIYKYVGTTTDVYTNGELYIVGEE